MPEIKTPSGQTVTLKDADQVTHGDRKRLMAVADNLSKAEQGFALMDNLLTLAITDWSYDLVIPSVKRESLDKLTPADYDAISEGTKPLMDAITPKTAADDEGSADPKAPTDS
jgi:hypothetical protein